MKSISEGIIIFIFMTIFLIIFAMCQIAHGASLKWDPVEVGAGVKPVKGYLIYFTRVGQTDNYIKDAGNVLTFDLVGLSLEHGLEYSFEVAAYNDDGPGDKSNTVSYLVPPNIPDENLPPVIIKIPPSGSITITIEGGD